MLGIELWFTMVERDSLIVLSTIDGKCKIT